MELEIAIGWALLNIFGLRWVASAQRGLPKLSLSTYILMLVPFSDAWTGRIDASHLDVTARYRMRLLLWCYLLLWLPLVLLAITLWNWGP
jgi:hypothetical protein